MMEAHTSAFRRTQSLRYPKGSNYCSALSPSSATSLGLARKGSKIGARSKSSKNRLAADSQSSLSRMTFNQRMGLISSWRALKPQTNSLMRKIFMELEIVSPKVKDIFYKAHLVDCFVNKEESSTNATLDGHVKFLIKFLDDLISNIDCEAESVAMIKRVGQHHAILNSSCGFHADIWEQLGEITMEKVCATDAVQKTREAGRAWMTVIAFITDNLRCGFEGETKVYSRRSSAEHSIDLPDGSEQNDELIRKLQQMRMDYSSAVPSIAEI